VFLGASQVLGTVSITNPGNADTYPVWTITGPGGPATITNITYGESFSVTGTLGTDVITVDTRPGQTDMRNQLSAPQWSRLGAGKQLWALRPGAQEVGLVVTGATSATSVVMTFRPRYKAA
jgi:hypothetical protein